MTNAFKQNFGSSRVGATKMQPLTMSEQGFSILEVLVGIAMISAAVVGAVSLLVSTEPSQTGAARNDRHEALVDSDIAQIQAISRNYTWCKDSGADTDPSTTPPPVNSNACNGVNPGHEDYYLPIPKSSTAADNAYAAFQDACLDTDPSNLLQPVITAINAISTAALTSDPDPITRTVTAVAALTADEQNQRRVRITYTNDSNTLNRVYSVVPAAVHWCPI